MSKELKRHSVRGVKYNGEEICGGFAYYDADDVDALLAEKDAAIAELKKKLMPCLNGDCILTCEVVEKYGKENAELKAKLEDVQASHYAEMVDAGMENHMLRRKLCLLRAEYAESRFAYYDNLNMTYRKDYVEERCGFWLKVKEYWQAKAEEYK